ncbi:beta strand repeat-containing protein [Rhodopila sp.]|uniref:beta strand repeat-containing protein n=1 Tax=Rhodopila sp. TaxID=2480087 RepID=UPI003D0A224B
MADFTWAGPASGDWNTGTLWTGGVVPNAIDADVTIDALTTVAYTATIAAGESFSVNSLTLNDVGQGANSFPYMAAQLELDGTLAFGPTSPGDILGSLQSYIYTPSGNNAEIINAGTLNGFIQASGNLLITGTNGVYITNDLQALGGTAVIDTKSIAEMTGNTLFDGIFEAKSDANSPPALIELGGSLQGDIVSIGTVQGPSPVNVPGGWTELSFTGANTAIEEWNGTGYVGVETSLTDIKGGGTVDVTDNNYVTSGSLTIEAQGTFSASGLLNLQGGTVTTGGLNINGGIVQGAGTIIGGVTNTGTLDALAVVLDGSVAVNTLDLTGSLTGTGTVLFDTIENQGPTATINPTGATLEVNGVSAGQTFVMNGDDTLQIDALSNFAGTVAAHSGDKLVLEGITATSAVLQNGTLSLKNGTVAVGSLALTGSFGGSTFATTSVAGGTQVNLGTALGGPTITAGATANYAAGSAGVALDAALTASDSGSAMLIGASVSISGGYLPGDTLSFTNQNGITGSYNAPTGILTLSGSATVANYQAALDTVAYKFSPGDPTGGGTETSRTISWSVDDGTNTATTTSSVAVSFNSIPAQDLLFQNTDGSLALWQTDGQSVNAYGTSLPSPGPQWTLVGTGGFFGSDAGDYVLQNQDGSVALWQVNGEHLTQGTVIANPGPGYQIRGTGDFFGDAKADTILLQGQDGSVALWKVQNGTITTPGFATLQSGAAANPGPAWQIRGVDDFSGDGKSDIVLQNQDGSVAIWNMNGTTVASDGVVVTTGTNAANPGPSWRVVGTGDFYGDGKGDVLLQNQDGSVAIWEIGAGETITQSGLVQFNGSTVEPGPTQHIVGTGDFNNDGKTDIVFRDDTGAVSTWEMNGTSIASADLVANPGLTYNSAGTGAMQFMYSAAAGETLTASAQVPDEFVFTNFAEGGHTIAGFNASQDVIELSAATFGSFAAVQNATSASGGGAVIRLDNNSSLLLSGVDRGSLHASNFALT